MRRDTLATAIGNFMEWYDFGVYGYIATTIAQVFYPGNSVSASISSPPSARWRRRTWCARSAGSSSAPSVTASGASGFW